MGTSIDVGEHEMFSLARRRAGLTQAWVAAAAGLQQPQISAWERGRRGLPAAAREALWAAVPDAAR